MAAHVYLKNEFTADKKCHNLMSWLISCFTTLPLDTEGGLWYLVVALPGDLFIRFLSFEPTHHKSNKMTVRPAKTQISPVWSESSLSAWRKLGSLATHWAHSEDWSDWADARTDLSLRWAHMPFCWFCHEAAHLLPFLVEGYSGKSLLYINWVCM